MSTIAIDLDGTLSNHPELTDLGKSLTRVGHNVVVLTAAAGELPREERQAEVERRLLNLGIPFPAICVEQHEKGRWCFEHDVSIIIDDTDSVLQDVASKSPRTVRLKVI